MEGRGGEDDLTITVFIKLSHNIKERKRAEGVADTPSAVYSPLMFRWIKALSKRTEIQELITRSPTIFPGPFFTGSKSNHRPREIRKYIECPKMRVD